MYQRRLASAESGIYALEREQHELELEIQRMRNRSKTSDDEKYKEDKDSSKEYIYKMQAERYKIFESQDVETGRFDVTFEIDGKMLHAHKFILTSISETMDIWLTDLWTNKDEVIKIKDYSYDDFYEFLRFLYSGDCEIKTENVFNIVDMAEFYGVQYLKKLCDKFLLKSKVITIENVEEMFEFSDKYSMPGFLQAVKNFVKFKGVLSDPSFLTFKKAFIEKVVIQLKGGWREKVFEAVYKWVEHQVNQRAALNNQDINISEAVKVELSTILPVTKFYKMKSDFLINFVVEKGFLLTPAELFKHFSRYRYSDDQADFKSVCDLAQKQALLKQKMSQNADFNLADSIKADLAEIIPEIKFYKMKKPFVLDFIVGNGILSEEQANRAYETRVEVKNGHSIINGVFMDNYGIRKKFEYPKEFYHASKPTYIKKARFHNVKLPIPSTPSTVMKMKGVEWYLCFEKDGVFTLKHYSLIERSDYLLAQMENNPEFRIHPAEKTRFTFSDSI
uniref:BTB domain-containing protein n=1 Tax=Panagrolaimus sp. ES5 TaxID=591445 RepID=A0AC34FU47_9BILA